MSLVMVHIEKRCWLTYPRPLVVWLTVEEVKTNGVRIVGQSRARCVTARIEVVRMRESGKGSLQEGADVSAGGDQVNRRLVKRVEGRTCPVRALFKDRRSHALAKRAPCTQAVSDDLERSLA